MTDIRPENIRNLKVLSDLDTLLAQLPRDAVVAQLGVDQGAFTRKILDIAHPRELHLIDPWPAPRHEEKFGVVQAMFAGEAKEGRVTIHRGKSIDEIARLPDSHFDWVYIDSTHEYEHTLRELRTCRRKIRPGGFIAGHDFTTGNVRKKLPYGVVQAVHEFCNSYDWEMVFLTHEAHRYLSFALRARSDAPLEVVEPSPLERAVTPEPGGPPPAEAASSTGRPRLDHYALKHSTDKSSRHHNYVRHYERYFAPLRDEPIHLLEIGIKEGASLRMWSDYFPTAKIFGLDLHPECQSEVTSRIGVFTGRQQNPEVLTQVCEGMENRLDIVIDDGSHHNPFTIASFEFLFPRLAPGGIYVIEDLHCSYEVDTYFKNKRSDMTDFFIKLLNAIDLNGRRDVLVPIKVAQDFGKLSEEAKAKLEPLERWVESVHFHQSICFIYKREA